MITTRAPAWVSSAVTTCKGRWPGLAESRPPRIRHILGIIFDHLSGLQHLSHSFHRYLALEHALHGVDPEDDGVGIHDWDYSTPNLSTACTPVGEDEHIILLYNLNMLQYMPIFHVLAFLSGFLVVILTLFSALSTFVLPRAARSQLNRVVFGSLRRVINFSLRFAKSYQRRDAIMAYYAPIGLMLLVPTWYTLILLGYAAMYWGLGVGNLFTVFHLSGSSLFTLGLDTSLAFWVSILIFSEAMLGLILVALLIAYLPTMYSAFSRREQAVNLLGVRAGTPPSALEMLMRFHRIHGLEKLADYWKNWEAWFADIEESHTTLPALTFFRSPRSEDSWITAAGTVLDAASLTLSAMDIPYEASAALCIRAGFLALRRITNYYDIPNPQNPHYPEDSISVTRAEFEETLDQLFQAGLPVKPDHEQAWRDFAGWRVNYDRVLLSLCGLVMAPFAAWSSDRISEMIVPSLLVKK